MLPIAESMKEPAKFSKVLDRGMIFIGFVFLTIGSLGYLAFGPNVQTIVFLNLPKRPEVTAIQFFYAIAIMLSFPLCVYPAIRITEQGLILECYFNCSGSYIWIINRKKVPFD
jgi:proton-coupled amino acid transporter